MQEEKISLNPKIYSLEIIFSAAYVMMERAYFFLDGDPDKEIIVKISPKKEGDAFVLKDFTEELINYSEYVNRSKNSKQVREMLLFHALSSCSNGKNDCLKQ